MKKIITILAVVFIIGFVSYSLFSKKTEAPAEVTNNMINNPVVESNTQTNQEVAININNFVFNPATLKIKVGTKVTWTNGDSAPHTITSDTGTVLNSPNLAKGESFSFTFTDVGTFAYHCAVHPMMKGNIVVEN